MFNINFSAVKFIFIHPDFCRCKHIIRTRSSIFSFLNCVTSSIQKSTSILDAQLKSCLFFIKLFDYGDVKLVGDSIFIVNRKIIFFDTNFIIDNKNRIKVLDFDGNELNYDM